MSPQIIFMLVASFGAFCQEVLHWIDLKNKLLEEETKKVFQSRFYWIITILTILISGIGSGLLFYDEKGSMKLGIPFILGAAFPLIFKKLVETKAARDLGSSSKSRAYSFQDVVKKYFK